MVAFEFLNKISNETTKKMNYSYQQQEDFFASYVQDDVKKFNGIQTKYFKNLMHCPRVKVKNFENFGLEELEKLFMNDLINFII